MNTTESTSQNPTPWSSVLGRGIGTGVVIGILFSFVQDFHARFMLFTIFPVLLCLYTIRPGGRKAVAWGLALAASALATIITELARG
jgi:hypothetical protein